MTKNRKTKGKTPVKIHMYDKDMKFVLTFLNQTECVNYYGLTNGRLFFNSKVPFREMPDGSFICRDRLGREGLKKALFIYRSKFCKVLPKDKPVEIYNALGENIGNFRSIRELIEICKMNPQSIQGSFISDTTGIHRKPKMKELSFKIGKWASPCFDTDIEQKEFDRITKGWDTDSIERYGDEAREDAKTYARGYRDAQAKYEGLCRKEETK